MIERNMTLTRGVNQNPKKNFTTDAHPYSIENKKRMKNQIPMIILNT